MQNQKSPQETVKAKKENILVVDDTPANLEILLSMLRREDYHVRVTTSGELALLAVSLKPPDLILLDINMPEMDGYEVCKRLKEDIASTKIPIIFISALGEVMDKVKAFKVGGADYITKPFQFEEVIARIENQLKSQRLIKLLEVKNLALARKNEELILSHKKAEIIFSALSKALPGSIINSKYRLEGQIGAGGFGAVYKAQNIFIQRDVAIKIFQPKGIIKSTDIEQFQKEAISSCRIQHPNAISVLDFGVTDDGLPYLVMELLEGYPLSVELKKEKTLPLKRVIEIAIPICQVLSVAHASNVIHRDVKPENIFIHKENDKEIVKLLDFGIAKIIENKSSEEAEDVTPYGKLLGTPIYMAPERLRGLPYDESIDIYSLGVMLYKMLVGTFPFDAKGGNSWLSLVEAHSNEEPINLRLINPDIPKEVEDTVLKAMSKESSERPKAKDLEQLLVRLKDSVS
jgi:CheY-like chemotaxis protein